MLICMEKSGVNWSHSQSSLLLRVSHFLPLACFYLNKTSAFIDKHLWHRIFMWKNADVLIIKNLVFFFSLARSGSFHGIWWIVKMENSNWPPAALVFYIFSLFVSSAHARFGYPDPVWFFFLRKYMSSLR